MTGFSVQEPYPKYHYTAVVWMPVQLTCLSVCKFVVCLKCVTCVQCVIVCLKALSETYHLQVAATGQ